MDPTRNPYAPGAGTPPPELAGRDSLIENVRIQLHRIRAGRSARSVMILGLRGVGKTVLLEQMRNDAEAGGIHTLRIEASESRSLPSVLAPELRVMLVRLSRTSRARDLARRGLRVIAGFVRALKFKYRDLEVHLDLEPEPGIADSGNLEHDLQDLLEVVGEACAAAETAMAMFIDEFQDVEIDQLAALVMALHRIAQRKLPVTVVGAGLPLLRGRMGRAKSYAERLFDFPELGPLSQSDAATAIVKPARALGVEYEAEAVDEIVRRTQGYPYFLQVWGSKCWDIAEQSPITINHVWNASDEAIADLDANFFRVRFDRLTPAERRYLRAMAEIGPGPHRSGKIAETLNKPVQSVAPTRNALIRKGMIYSPGHGDTAFTVPFFDGFMKRIMPGTDDPAA